MVVLFTIGIVCTAIHSNELGRAITALFTSQARPGRPVASQFDWRKGSGQTLPFSGSDSSGCELCRPG
jgi:hypothetical protein